MDLNALIGRDVAGFRLTHRLGEGGMAMVFRSENVLDPSIVRAIKIVHPHLSAQPEFVKRITLEARILDQLHHPNIVRFYGLRQASVDHTSLLVMELEMLDGQPLSSLVRPNLPVAQAVEWIRQASEGVAAAHALGIVHRDLKPENLIVTKSGQIKVLDFGIAKAFDDARRVTQVTMAGVIPGTPGYMAPEVCNGAVPTAAADVYALGVTLCELLLGRHPFAEPGQAPLSGLQMMFAHTQRDMPRLRATRGDVSESLQTVLDTASARTATERFKTADVLAIALRQSTPSRPPESVHTPRTEAGSSSANSAVSLTDFKLPNQGQISNPSFADESTMFVSDAPSCVRQTQFELPQTPSHSDNAHSAIYGARPLPGLEFLSHDAAKYDASAPASQGYQGRAGPPKSNHGTFRWTVAALVIACVTPPVIYGVRHAAIELKLRARRAQYTEGFYFIGKFSKLANNNNVLVYDVPLEPNHCYRFVGASFGWLHLRFASENGEWSDLGDTPVVGTNQVLRVNAGSRGALQVYGRNAGFVVEVYRSWCD